MPHDGRVLLLDIAVPLTGVGPIQSAQIVDKYCSLAWTQFRERMHPDVVDPTMRPPLCTLLVSIARSIIGGTNIEILKRQEKRDHPTDPSSEIPNSFCASTANSIGSCCSTSRAKPLTISATAAS